VELLRLDEVLLSGDLEPRILADFRDAFNRVKTLCRFHYQLAQYPTVGRKLVQNMADIPRLRTSCLNSYVRRNDRPRTQEVLGPGFR
jgi:hypothetical protein